MVRFLKHQLDQSGDPVSRKLEVLHVHRRQFPSPCGQDLSAAGVFADSPQDRWQILAAVAQYGLTGESGLPHLVGHEVQEPHVGQDSYDVFGAVLVTLHDLAVLSKLCQRRLVRAHFDTMAVPVLIHGLCHAEKQVCVVTLIGNRIVAVRVAGIDGPELFSCNPE